MKLRNKKTGKIQTCEMVVITDEQMDREIASLNKHTFLFRSVEQFNDEYEAYKPTEPLIKDEKVRKAVRAWAEANGIDELTYYSSSHYWYLRASNNHDQSIDFWISYNRDPELIENKRYTITELCGEMGE